jgi:hypothetical protein
MSYRHIESIVPGEDHYRHRPTAQQLIAAVDCLVKHQYCNEEKSELPYASLYNTAGEVREALRAAPEGVVVKMLDRGMKTPPPDEWPADEPELTPDLCEQVTIVSSPWLLVATYGGVEPGSIACPECGGNALDKILEQHSQLFFAEGDKGPESVLTDENFKLAPPACPLCGKALAHEEMALESGDKYDPAPFFHFAIRITAIRQPSVEMVYFHPDFLAELSDAIGVPLRSLSEYS